MLKTRKQNKKKKGFTLIELIVVLAVLAIIALIAIPNFNQIRENSKIKSDERGADHIDKAVTLLVQDGTITTDATYTYNGTSVSTGANQTDIAGVLTGTKGPQQDGVANFSIAITGTDTPDPSVEVTVGAYTSDVN